MWMFRVAPGANPPTVLGKEKRVIRWCNWMCDKDIIALHRELYCRGIAAIEIFNFQNQGNGGGRQRYLSGARLGGREAVQGGQVQGWGGFLWGSPSGIKCNMFSYSSRFVITVWDGRFSHIVGNLQPAGKCLLLPWRLCQGHAGPSTQDFILWMFQRSTSFPFSVP